MQVKKALIVYICYGIQPDKTIVQVIAVDDNHNQRLTNEDRPIQIKTKLKKILL